LQFLYLTWNLIDLAFCFEDKVEAALLIVLWRIYCSLSTARPLSTRAWDNWLTIVYKLRSKATLFLTSIMATLYGHDKHYNFIAPQEETVHPDDINRIKKELDLLKNAVWINITQKPIHT